MPKCAELCPHKLCPRASGTQDLQTTDVSGAKVLLDNVVTMVMVMIKANSPGGSGVPMPQELF